MKILIQVIAWMLLAYVGGAYAQTPDILGTWQGKLAVDANTQLTLDVMFTRRPDGAYVAVLNSPDNAAVKNLVASNVTFTNGELKFDVPSLSGSYAATLKDGKLDGQWKQPTGTLPLVLAPPRVVPMSAAARDTLLGAWSGPLKVPNGQLTIVLRFRQNAKGEVIGTMGSPDQNSALVQVSDLAFVDNKLSLKVPSNLVDVTMTQANGVMTGTFRQPGMGPEGLPLTLTKGEAAGKTYPLTLSSEAYTALAGSWSAKVGAVNVAVRVERDAKGIVFGWVDNVDMKVSIPLSAATVAGTKVTFTVAPPADGGFTGDLAGKVIKGTWTQNGKPVPVELKKN